MRKPNFTSGLAAAFILGSVALAGADAEHANEHSRLNRDAAVYPVPDSGSTAGLLALGVLSTIVLARRFELS